MLWNGNLQEFLDWFVAYETTDEADLKKALRSAPEGSWATVYVRLEGGLDKEEAKLPPHVGELWIFPDGLQDHGVLDKKKRLLIDERNARLPQSR